MEASVFLKGILSIVPEECPASEYSTIHARSLLRASQAAAILPILAFLKTLSNVGTMRTNSTRSYVGINSLGNAAAGVNVNYCRFASYRTTGVKASVI